MRFPFINLRRLGGGGFGEVFVGQRAQTGETVVVKFLVEAGHPAFRAQFARELRVLLNAVHGRVMRVLDWDLDAARPYYVMPYLPGGALLKHVGRLPDRDVVAFGSQIAEAVATMHAQELIHGDLKPDNVLMDGGQVLVSDPLGNGAGCTVTFGTKQGGTPGYMGPELVRGAAISKPGDVYALGALLFHVATGLHPKGRVLDPRRHRPGVDLGLNEIIRACVVSDPRARPTMAEVYRRLVARWHAMQQAPVAPANPVAGLLGAAAIVGVVALIAKGLSGK